MGAAAHILKRIWPPGLLRTMRDSGTNLAIHPDLPNRTFTTCFPGQGSGPGPLGAMPATMNSDQGVGFLPIKKHLSELVAQLYIKGFPTGRLKAEFDPGSAGRSRCLARRDSAPDIAG